MRVALWVALVFALAILAVAIYVFVQFMIKNWDAIAKEEKNAQIARAANEKIQAPERVAGVTFVVTTSPVPDNPSTTMIERVVNSAILMHGMPEKIVVAMDGLAPGAANPDYDAFQQALTQRMPHATVVRRSERGYLTGNIENALEHVETRFILVIQHDFEHVVPVDLRPLMRILDDGMNDVQHIRFNKRNNWQRELWDFHPSYDMEPRVFGKGGNANGDADALKQGATTLLTTPAWSDNDHLCLTSYYRDVVLPITRKANKRFPEEAMNPLNREQPGKYGTYIFGDKRQTNTILHLDGKVFSSK